MYYLFLQFVFLVGIKNLLDADKGVKSFLETPVIDRKAKKQGIEIILGSGKSQTTTNFFGRLSICVIGYHYLKLLDFEELLLIFVALLADNGRLNQTSKIIAAFQSLMIAHRGEVNVVVTSAKELDSKMLTKVKEVLAKNQLGGAGKKLLISNKVHNLYFSF